jgi:hypothetical protein
MLPEAIENDITQTRESAAADSLFGGLRMSEEMTEIMEEGPSENNSDWDNRVLCSDGNCIGVIGPDGHCKECGKPYKGKLPEGHRSISGAPEAQRADRQVDTATEGEETETGPDAMTTADDSDWDTRVLCSDGNCIGVIGSDGLCKECGKPFREDAE